MKKIIAFLLIALLLLTSCDTPESPAKLEDYNVELSEVAESGIFNVPGQVIQSDVPAQEKLDAPIESEIKLGNKTIVADLTSKYVDSNKSIYVSKDGKINYVKSGDSDSFSISVRGSGVLRSFKKDSFNEEELVNNIKDYISEYLDLSMLDSYVYTCSTKLQVSKPDAAWNETKEGFYVSNENGETVRSYTVEYRKYYNNYKTADYMSINCDPNGNILAFAFYDSNTDWSGGEFDGKSVEQCVEKYLKDSIKSEWSLKDYEFENECLVYVDGKIYLSLSVDLTLTKNGDEANTLCALRVSK